MGIRINDLQEIFSQWPYHEVYWLVVEHHCVIHASYNAENKFSIVFGQPVMEHPLIRKVMINKKTLTEKYHTWQGDKLVSTSVVAIPIGDQDVNDGRILLYGMDHSPAVENIDKISALIHSMNSQQNAEKALNVFVKECLNVFGCQMAGIWIFNSGKYYLLAKSTENPQDEIFLNELSISDDLGIEFDKFFDLSTQGLLLQFNHPGFKHVLSYPLQHLGEQIGIVGLFTTDSREYDSTSMLWLNQLAPFAASLVYEYKLREAALEREKDLNLLVWGTEILVQVESEDQLLVEAGEMAMVLNLEAGFFLMRQKHGWEVRAPFGRLKQNDCRWEEWIFDQMQLDPTKYKEHGETYVHVLAPSWTGKEESFPWRKLLIQPVQTNNGLIGELWLLDFVDTNLEARIEIFAAFARSLGVALEMIRQRRELEQMATTDPLTGALNLQGLSQRFQPEMAATMRHNATCLFLLLDLDGFKRLNDTHGHPVGDQALCKIAANIKATIRENDILARSGGDEFILVLTDMKKGPEAEHLINRLKKAMGLSEYELGVSIGVAEFPTEADNYERLYHLADQRLYVGKNSGKNKVIFE